MGNALKLLIVEDCDDDVFLLLEELKQGGYDLRYERVENADDMAAALKKPIWDLVISDYSLPGFSAFGALELLKEKVEDVPFIVMSGTIGEDRAAEILKAGASDFITKGKMHRLIPAITRELRESKGRRERKRVERALEESETKFEALCESAADAIISTNDQGSILTCNNAAEGMFGIAKPEIIGASIEVLIPQAGIAQRSHLPADKKLHIMEGVKKGGVRFPIEVSLTNWVSGNDRFCAAIIRDVSERQRLEAQLRQSQKMEAIGQLAGGVAHDFNNLLTIINGRSQLLINAVKPGEKIRKDLELIFRTGERAAVLTRQLLAFSRKQMLRPKSLNLNSVAADMDQMLRRLISEDIALMTILDPKLKSVLADPGQIEQVIMNLVVNARDAMPNGGKIIIETSNVELSEDYCRSRSDLKAGNHVMLAVSDTGCGIPPDVKARLFEPFFTTKAQGKGTGLGLSTVFGIVKQSGGHIEVYSEPEKGSVFKIYLPQNDAAAEPASSDKLVAVSQGNEVVLIVEDEEGVRDLVHDFLKENGYTVLISRNGNEALEVCQQHRAPIHLLITDVVMPEMGGPELVMRIKESRPKMKVLFTSGYTDNAVVRNGLLQPGMNFIEKPFTPTSFVKKVREILDNA